MVERRRTLAFLAVAAGGFVLLNAALGAIADPLPDALVRSKAAEVGGFKVDELRATGGGYEHGVFGRSAHLEFKLRGKQRTKVRVEIRRPVHLLPWKLSAYQVDDQ